MHMYLITFGILLFSAGFMANSLVDYSAEINQEEICSSPENCAKPSISPTAPNLLLDLVEADIPKEEMGKMVVAFLNKKFLGPQGAEGELLDVKTQGKYLYIVDLIIKKDEATQQASIYVTKDGKLILLGEGGGIIEITEESDLQTSATSIEENVSQPPTINTGINISTAAYVSGPGDASITIIEFNDYQCPFCKRFRDETLDLIIDQYGDNIKYVLMDFPITSIHPQAFIAHIAARCAGEQNRYFEYHDKLFANQLLWSKFPPESEDEINELKKYAEELRLDKSRFDQCLDSKKYAEDILNNMQEGVNAGVTGTPAFFINGQIVRGAQPFRVFQQIIEAELAKK